MSFRGSGSESRNLPKWQALSCGGSYSNVVDSSTPLRCGRNDITGDVSTDSPIVCAMFHAVPHFPHQSRPRGEPASPRGSFCTVLWVVPFTPTGCIRDVDGGRLPPLHRIRPTKYHFFDTARVSERSGRQVAAPACTRVGGTVQLHGFYSGRHGRHSSRPLQA